MSKKHSQNLAAAGIQDLERVRAVAESLAPAQVRRVIACQGGGNNRVYLLETGAERFALKFYPAGVERLRREASALQFMQTILIDRVPRMIAHDETARAALLTWIDGAPAGPIRDSDIEEMVAFTAALKQATAAPASAGLSLATEACLSGRQIAEQIERRMQRLTAIDHAPDLRLFLTDRLRPALTAALTRAETAAGSAWTEELPESHRTLSPSDFGAHNALRGPAGNLQFLDFEYFGWDDPVKLLADCWWHPGMALDQRQGDMWLDLCRPVFGSDPGLLDRLRAFQPLFGLRWICIVLNEFLPERWEHRRAAGRHEDWAEAKAQQLAKADALLHRLLSHGHP